MSAAGLRRSGLHPARQRPDGSLPARTVLEVRAALQAGASPGAALGAVRSGPLAGPAAAARLGRPLAEVAVETATGDRHADLLVRALAVAERTGAGGVTATDQALAAAEEERHVEHLLAARTAQARLSAIVLTAIPLALWTLLVAADAATLAFYRTGAGVVSGSLALALGAGGWRWARRIAARAAAAAAAADPLAPPRSRFDAVRAAALGLPVLAVGALMAGMLVGLALAVPVAALAGRPPARGRPRRAPVRSAGPAAGSAGGNRGSAGGNRGSAGGNRGSAGGNRGSADADSRSAGADVGAAGGAAEAVELVAAAMQAGLDARAAFTLVAPLAPPAARPVLEQAVARLRAGTDVAAALEGTGLADLGAVLHATLRWGAPAHDALGHLAADIRARRRAAAEEAAERAQIALIFPTTLLTLPAFVAAVVPPLVWAAFAR